MKIDCRATIFAGDFDEHPSDDYVWVAAWLEKWGENIIVASYSTGGWEHIWNVSGPKDAIEEIPENLLCGSDWAGVTGVSTN
ncbi:hypothetical protein [Pseudophaeobacter sp. TrK17]|jgi:hypothetical protein|uniref:hypothetical protein n=1 Tax=Pseudophaeobacter sp. TrK17 TaxID=2815167 RepID=UPI0035D0D45E